MLHLVCGTLGHHLVSSVSCHCSYNVYQNAEVGSCSVCTRCRDVRSVLLGILPRLPRVMHPAHASVSVADRGSVIQPPSSNACPVVHAADVAVYPRQCRHHQCEADREPDAVSEIHRTAARDSSHHSGKQAADSEGLRSAG